MGLTSASTGRGAIDSGLAIDRTGGAPVIALAGNPNVGKSTVFNALTGLKQHTGNWSGKTVATAQGICRHGGREYILVDIPGAYSLFSLSAEEEVARDFLCFGGADATIIVCDATCLERNLNLVLQTTEITPRVVVCVNLLDEAQRKHIHIDLKQLESLLGVPVIGTSARAGRGLDALLQNVDAVMEFPPTPRCVHYPQPVENAVRLLELHLASFLEGRLSPRWTALKLLEGDRKLIAAIESYVGKSFQGSPTVQRALEKAAGIIRALGYDTAAFRDMLVSSIYAEAEAIVADAVRFEEPHYNSRQLCIDRFLTRRSTGIPVMLLLLGLIFYITIKGANIPSAFLSNLLFRFQDTLSGWIRAAGAPEWLHGALVLGVYRVMAWVISVMLPPMAIFFPLFTLLEDLGYLPRVAFNLDNAFRRCNACGKQALTTAMGFGCNAAGVTGCRIISSPRERLIAMLTNSFVPCNGRFPPPPKGQKLEPLRGSSRLLAPRLFAEKLFHQRLFFFGRTANIVQPPFQDRYI